MATFPPGPPVFMSHSLTIVGVSARAAAQTARRAGFAPHSVDLFADLDAQTAGSAVKVDDYPNGFLAGLRGSPDSPWMYAGGLENYPALVEQLARERRLLGNSGETLRAVRDPVQLARAVQAAGYFYPTVDEANAQQSRVFKPLASGGGRGVAIVPAEDGRPVPPGWYQQTLVKGLPVSALYVADGETSQLLGASRQLIGSDFGLTEPFCYVGSIAPLPCSEAVRRQFAEIGSVVAGRFALRGLFGIDFALQAGTLWVLEVNPRLTASAEVIERATGCNAIARHIAACGGELPSTAATMPAVEPNTLQGKAIVYARAASVAGDRFANLTAEWNQANWPMIADLPAAGTRFAPGEPVATVFACGGREVDVIQSLRDRCERVLATLDRAN